MNPADTTFHTNPAVLGAFVRTVARAGDSPTVIRRVAGSTVYMDLCRRIIRLDTARGVPTLLAEACRANGITFPSLLARLTPAAQALYLLAEDGRDGYYQVLGVAPDSGADAIRQAYRRRARELHPDLKPGKDGDHHAFAVLTTAYQTLSDPAAKQAYDARRQPDDDTWFEPEPQQAMTPPRRARFTAVIVVVGILAAAALVFDRLDGESVRRQAHQDTQAVVIRPISPPVQRVAVELPATSRPGGQVPPPRHDNTPENIPATVLSARPTTDNPETSGPTPQDNEAIPAPTRKAPLAALPRDTPADPGDVAERSRLAVFFASEREAGLARELAAHLSGRGYPRPRMARAPFEQTSNIRYFHGADQDRARSLQRAVRRFLARAIGRPDLPVRLKNLSTRYPLDEAGLLEIWINTRPLETTPAAAPIPASQAAPDPPPPTASTEAKIVSFLENYCRVYESRDPDRLAGLFDPEATENGRPFLELLPRYRTNLARLEQLSYRIEMDHWEPRADGTALSVQGRFFARGWRTDRKDYRSRGTILLDIAPHGDSFRVARLVYKIEK